MNKIRIGHAATVLLAVAASALTVGVGSANAATTAPAADPICTGYGDDNRLDWDYIKNRSTGVHVGVVELCQRWDTDGRLIRWTNVRLGYTMNPGEHANGHIVFRPVNTTNETVFSTCKDGGTGEIWAPDRACSTGKTWWVSGYQDRADAYIYNVNGALIAAGATNWTN